MRESWRATMGSVRVKKQGGRLSRAWRARKDSCQVLSQEGSQGGVLASHKRLSTSPGKTHAESWTRGEPRKSHRVPQETQPESESKEKDSGESCEPGETHAKSQTRGEP